MTREAQLAAALSRSLSLSVHVAVAEGPTSLARLSQGEAARLASLGEPRHESWLRGRAALKRLLAAVGDDEDTAWIAFPHPRFSLTHGGTVAVAVATGCQGTGVDFERRRPLRPETVPFFLAPEEREQLGATDLDLLRLWTVKEAVFKADVENGGRGLGDYLLPDLRGSNGVAVRRGAGGAYRYTSLEWREGVLTMAVRSEA